MSPNANADGKPPADRTVGQKQYAGDCDSAVPREGVCSPGVPLQPEKSPLPMPATDRSQAV